jgi:hypothetical protein
MFLFSQKGYYLLHNLFLKDEARFHLNGHTNSQNGIRSVENSHTVLKNYVHSSEIGVWCALFRKRNVRILFLEEKIIAENYPVLMNASLCWKGMNGIAGFSNRGQPPILPKHQQLSCTSFVMALSGVDFG